jgi:hypothetical protein
MAAERPPMNQIRPIQYISIDGGFLLMESLANFVANYRSAAYLYPELIGYSGNDSSRVLQRNVSAAYAQGPNRMEAPPIRTIKDMLRDIPASYKTAVGVFIEPFNGYSGLQSWHTVPLRP